MRSFALFLSGALLSLASVPALAHPGHGEAARDLAATLPLVARKGTLNDTELAGASNVSIADDHVPTFKTADCVCPEPMCDTRLNAASFCQCQAQAKLACFKSSNGGCPKPDDNACPTSAT